MDTISSIHSCPTFPVSFNDDTYKLVDPRELWPNPAAAHARILGTWCGLGMDWTRLQLLWASIFLFFLFFFIKKLWCIRIFTSFAIRLGIKPNQPAKIRKFCQQLWLLLFYVFASFVGYFYVLRDKPFAGFPVVIPDQGIHFWNYVAEKATNPEYTVYYCIVMGFYASELATVFIEPHRKDFFQYVAHHICTLLLLSGSFGSYNTRVGVYVEFIHDISDIFLCAAKVAHYSNHENAVTYNFILFVLGFVFFRLFCFPIAIASCYLQMPLIEVPSMMPWILTYLLCFLQVLQIFWFCMIIVMIYRLATGVKGDVRSDDEGGDGFGEEAAEGKEGKDKLSPKPATTV